MKRVCGVFLVFLLMLFFSFNFVLAEEAVLDQAEFADAELTESGGITPDSAFYFLDRFFDRFGDSLEIREEKISEIKAMIEKGDIEGAKKALEIYKEEFKEVERELDPEKREETLRSAAAIRNTLREIEDQIPEEERGEFVDEVISKEEGLATATEIASKIKELCETLSGLDPLEYSRVCKIEGDAPEWQKRLHKDLTEEQREEAKKFGEIMGSCFKTSGKECRCEEIPYTEFSKVCSIAAPLATACDLGGDEEACDKLDALELPELPDYLEDVMDEIEERYGEESFDHHIPGPCKEAGITGESSDDRKKCMKIMIEKEAPPECRDALLEAGDIGEREARKICDKIMFDLEGPEECKEAGITEFDECGKYMFKLHAPQECIDAGLTGASRSDERKCKELVGDFHGDDMYGHRGPVVNVNCQNIQDPEERLDCYDKASSQVKSYGGGFNDENYDGPCMTDADWKAKKDECRKLYGQHAGDEPIMGDSGEGYECVIDAKCVNFGKGVDYGPWSGCEALMCQEGHYCEYGECKPFGDGGPYTDHKYDGPICDDCEAQCGQKEGKRLRGTGCGPNGCECYYEDIEDKEYDDYEKDNYYDRDYDYDYSDNDYPKDDYSNDYYDHDYSQDSGDYPVDNYDDHSSDYDDSSYNEPEESYSEPEPEESGSNDEPPAEESSGGEESSA